MHHTPNGSFQRGGKTSRDEAELDKLLQGLDKLTETLPDLAASEVTDITNTRINGANSRTTVNKNNYQSRDNYDGGLSTLKQNR